MTEKVRYGRTLIALTLAVLLVSWAGRFGGWTGWPWDPLRLSLVFVAVVAVRWWPLRSAALVMAVWAVLACPIAVGPSAVSSGGDTLLNTGVPAGPYTVYAGSLPIGRTWLTTPDKLYVNGEGDDAGVDLVAWSVSWLPWPHIDRARVAPLGGVISNWQLAPDIQVRRQDHRLVVSSETSDPLMSPTRREYRALVLGGLVSSLTWLGWFAILGALGTRVWQRRQAPDDARPRF